jgi:DNA gyrase subunit B
MPVVLEKGYIYIAQPPLYRAKKGQSETYLKDESALTEYLLSSGLDSFEIKNKKIETADMRQFILNIQRFYAIMKVSSRKYDTEVLYYLLSKVTDLESVLKDESKLKSTLADLKACIFSKPMLGITEIEFSVTNENGKVEAVVNTTRYADRKATTLNLEMLNASEIIEIRGVWKTMQSISLLPLTTVRNAQETSFESYLEFYTQTMENTKKGIYIQRYKGLGEMNPEQLWDTTLNPVNRNLLRVTIDDAVAADETFSVLMGEQVEPRRKFIQDNALSVRALDV